jgi:GDPmannose 4,6-dehydratase
MTTARATAQLNRRAIVTGVQGQDGYYLSRMLLDRGYQVTGISRRHSSKYDRGPVHYDSEYREIEGDICDTSFMMSLIKKEQPNEFYNLAAQSHVGYSFENPDTTFDVNANAVLGMLESIRLTSPHTKFYQASTSEMFGTVASGMASERTTLSPASPYGVAKTAAHHMVRVYRESYGLFACSGILFNHESSRRGKDFVTRKVTAFVADYKRYVPTTGQKLKLGNIESVRDWGWAPDYVRGMMMMLDKQNPDDYVLATGGTRSIRNLLDVAFNHVGITDWTKIVEHNTPEDLRPNDVTRLCGNADKARYELGWEPTIGFEQMIREMVDAEKTL